MSLPPGLTLRTETPQPFRTLNGDWVPAGPPKFYLDGLHAEPRVVELYRDRCWSCQVRDVPGTIGPVVSNLEITAGEAQRIMNGERPGKVLLGLPRYHLAVVPWTPQEKR